MNNSLRAFLAVARRSRDVTTQSDVIQASIDAEAVTLCCTVKNVPRLHHYVPEGYLRRFVDDEGALWVFDRRRQEVRRQRPEVSGAEREMYTP